MEPNKTLNSSSTQSATDNLLSRIESDSETLSSSSNQQKPTDSLQVTGGSLGESDRRLIRFAKRFERELAVVPNGDNPYVSFFKRKPHKAAIWKDLPMIDWDEMNVNEMAETVTHCIAADFMDWFKSTYGDGESDLSIQRIKDMFQVGPNKLSTSRVYIEMSRPLVHQAIPSQTNLAEDINSNQSELETMANVWNGITHLKSTKTFCERLPKSYPTVKPPKCLVDAGLIDIKMYK
ncbi:unnamed protein product [Phyllotreta striolata]|uniref:Uncharacterized protein n=1 Tax=Phyllotreta striolata TaxID=444603 RepID=A0A9N9TT42_PHYSR|nr:unnamed protein product [Phyllotreta striolata]